MHENPGAPNEYMNGIKKIGSLASMKKQDNMMNMSQEAMMAQGMDETTVMATMMEEKVE